MSDIINDLIGKKHTVPVLNFKRFPDEDTQVYTIINKEGQRELTDAAAKKIKFRVDFNIIPKVKIED